MRSNLKECKSCQQFKPIRDFDSKRHRECHDCRVRKGKPAIEAWLHLEAWARQSAHLAEQAAAHSALEARTVRTDYQRVLKNQRERQRLEAANKPRKNKPTGKPRQCRRCKRRLGAELYRDAYVRICVHCDGPEPLVVQKSRR